MGLGLPITGLNICKFGLKCGCRVLSLDWDRDWSTVELCTWIGTTHELGLIFMAGNGEIWTKIYNILVKWTEKQRKKLIVACKLMG